MALNQFNSYQGRLEVKKDQEVKRQVADLAQRGMIEPVDKAWSSSVVLVYRKDHFWGLCIDYKRLNAIPRKDATRFQSK